jgi:hypothetical protein
VLFFNLIALAPIVVGVFIEVESIVVTGPLLFLLGIATIITGQKSRHPSAWVVGSAQCAVCLFILALILILDWSPRQAQVPVSAAAVAYALLITPALVLASFFTKPRFDPYRCQTCDYPLIGLPSPRCPECGTPFDPFQVPNWPKAETNH